ncbi:uncharacterized protein LOC134257152 [Saccostrea cucullata]|uniref:uncharacterized protein LOC134257152 n=1 Tax=Saccostrea cuccullata TaxID=36930 RepID=UPI002ED2E764
MTDIENYEFSVDFQTAATKELGFLKTIDEYPSLYGGPVLKYAIFRYETLWLPFAAEHKDLTLTAPLDIAWVWHCHLLAPVMYVSDCLRTCNTEVNHSLTPTVDAAGTEQLWSKKYPDVNFNVNLVETGIKPPSYESRIQYDLEAAAERQQMFYYQVSLPHYTDEKFLQNAITRYKQFLTLKRLNPESFVVPCYDVDLIWHSHQVHPVGYKKDTETLLGKLFNHDDSVNDRKEGSKLVISDRETRTLWREAFGTNFSEFGAMYRGKPPRGHLFSVSSNVIEQHCSKHLEFQLNKAEIIDYTSALKVHQLKLNAVFRNGVDIELLKLKKPVQGVWNTTSHKIPMYDIDTEMVESISVELFKYGALGKLGSKTLVGSGRVTCREMLQDCKKRSSDVSSIVRLSNGESIELHHTIKITESRDCALKLEAGNFEMAIIPEHNEDLWGPMPLPRLPEGVDNSCSVANHRIRNADGEVMFTARVIHSLPLMTSVVHVYYHDKLNVVCHLIGPDTLPTPTQVQSSDENSPITLSPQKGERAMIIKNNEGDWAILVGRWTGVRKGVPGRRATKHQTGRAPIRGSPGHLEVTMYRLPTGERSVVELDSEQFRYYDFTVKFHGFEADFSKCTVKISPTDGAENLALVFCISVLQVLCQPRPPDWEPVKETTSEMPAYVSKKKEFPVDKLALVMAFGFQICSPSNHLLRKHFKKKKEDKEHVAPVYAGGTVSEPMHDTPVIEPDVYDDDDGNDDDQEVDQWEAAMFCCKDEDFENMLADEDGEDGDDGNVDNADGDPGGCGGCGGCGGGDGYGGEESGGGWGGDTGGYGGDNDDGGGGGGWGGDTGGDDGGGGWGGDTGGGGDGGGGDSGGGGGGGDGGGCGGGCGGCGG